MLVVLKSRLGGPIRAHCIRGAVYLGGGCYWDLSNPVRDQVGAMGFGDCRVSVYNGSTGIGYVGVTHIGSVGWVGQ